MRQGLRNIIGNTISGMRKPSPILQTFYLLWKLGSNNKMLVNGFNNDKLVWK